MVGLFHGKPHLEMDDDWGYPYFRKPPNHHKSTRNKCVSSPISVEFIDGFPVKTDPSLCTAIPHVLSEEVDDEESVAFRRQVFLAKRRSLSGENFAGMRVKSADRKGLSKDR